MHHWVDVIDTCVRAGDPLAYGIDMLREARATVAADLNQLEAPLPPDRSADLAQALEARRQVFDAQQTATADLHTADDRLTEARRRRRGRRDPEEIARAEEHHADVQHRYNGALTAYNKANERAATLAIHQQEHVHALAPGRDRQTALRVGLARLDAALDDTRAERVLALLRHPSPQLLAQLGRPGTHSTAQAAWCHHAYRLETHADRADPGLLPALRFERQVRRDVDAAASLHLDAGVLRAGPSAWSEVVDAAQRLSASPFDGLHTRDLGLHLER